jgi:Rne/Rng family ribonuclease
LIIDRTEAMTVIDVNTGKFTGAGGNLEATVTSNNLEAAEEIVRQLRLRDIGGIIVIDFIDMVLPNNRELLLRRLVEGLGRDRTRHQVAEITSLGLVQMTRKKIGAGLLRRSRPSVHSVTVAAMNCTTCPSSHRSKPTVGRENHVPVSVAPMPKQL